MQLDDQGPLPELPLPKPNAVPGTQQSDDIGPVLPVPRDIRPTLATYRYKYYAHLYMSLMHKLNELNI